MLDITNISDATVADIKAAIADAPDDERDILKAEIRTAEEATGSPRAGVLEATAVELAEPQAPATPDDDELPDAVSASERDAQAENDRIAKVAADSGQVSLADTTQQ